jgi:hypothetical protein
MNNFIGDWSSNGLETVTFDTYNTETYLQVGRYEVYPNYWYPYWEREIHHWYPTLNYATEKSKVEQAFKIVGKLIEEKIIKDLNVKQFIKLVKDIALII